jgi:hypothetical protein
VFIRVNSWLFLIFFEQNLTKFAKNLRLFNIQNRFLCPKPPFSPNFAQKKIGQTRKFFKIDFLNLQSLQFFIALRSKRQAFSLCLCGESVYKKNGQRFFVTADLFFP